MIPSTTSKANRTLAEQAPALLNSKIQQWSVSIQTIPRLSSRRVTLVTLELLVARSKVARQRLLSGMQSSVLRRSHVHSVL